MTPGALSLLRPRIWRPVVVLLALALWLLGSSPAGATASAEVSDSSGREIRHRAWAGEWFVHRPARLPVEYRNLPDGALVYAGERSFVLWRPADDDVGRHEFTEVGGLGHSRRERVVRVDVRATPRPDVLLAMGDSIASGHGLQSSDYFGLDSCWRDRGGSYSGRVVERLAGSGITEHRMVACSGARVADLWADEVSGGPAGLDGGSQLDWALQTNPGVITLTVGANDLRFDRPDEYFEDGRFDHELIAARIASMQADLDVLLGRLVSGTDAVIVLTGVHNPVSTAPHGVSGCRSDCFVDIVSGVSDDLNRALEEVAERHTRVSFADLDDRFDGHGAPNGRGPDWLRAGGGWFTSRLPIPTRGVHPYCEKGHGDGDTWINAADCVHPNGEGHEAYAEAVMAALAGRGVS